MRRFLLGTVGLIVLLSVLIYLWHRWRREGDSKGGEPLMAYCGAGLREPVERLAKQFEAETGIPVRLQYGSSQALLLQAELSKTGDLYLPGDESFVELARTKGLIGEDYPLARMRAVLAVKKGNPKGVRSLEDLLRPDVKLGQVNPDSAAAGKLVREALRKAGRWDRVAEHTCVFTGTVNEVAAAIKLGSIDAGFIWDVLISQMTDLEEVPFGELVGAEARVTVGLLKSSTQAESAMRFARYLASPETGGRAFQASGFEPPATQK
ncbi:MAG TPA: molybdate ABC transporter substrate-binding protein [Planctomycetota bacterium]|nr:molybdate ABC transporter substrate-binding protein [Planctomycetota bacterium]